MQPLLLLVALACTEGSIAIDGPTPVEPVTVPPEPTPPARDEACANGIDDDQDGATDCEDTDCIGHEACFGYPLDTLIRDIPVPFWAQICREFARETPGLTTTCPGTGVEVTVPPQSTDDWFASCFSTFSTADRWTCDATYGDFVTASAWDVDPCVSPPPEVLAIDACQQPDCSTIIDKYPPNDATDVYNRGSLRWTLDAASPTPTVNLERATGANVSGSGRWAGDTWVWTPATPLLPNTDYVATFSACNQTEVTPFRTSTIGAPIHPPALVGKTYAFDLGGSDVTYIQPAGLGSIIASQFTSLDFQLLLGITTASSTELDLLLGAGGPTAPVSQHLWFPTNSLNSGFAANPFFSTTPVDLDVPFGDVAELTLLDLRFEGSVSPTSDLLGGLTVTATIDTRQLAGFTGGSVSTCALVPVFGLSCEPCPDGSGSFCLPIEVVQAAADEVPGVTMIPVSGP